MHLKQKVQTPRLSKRVSSPSILQHQIKSQWRNSLNQFSKLEQESKMSMLDSKVKKVNHIKLKMKNRLAQIDDDFIPQFRQKSKSQSSLAFYKKNKILSTNHDSNNYFSDGLLSNLQWEQSILDEQQRIAQQQNPQHPNLNIPNSLNNDYKCSVIREQLMEQLTEYNQSKYVEEMKQKCHQFNSKMQKSQQQKSTLNFLSYFVPPPKQLYEFCYKCDQIMNKGQENQKAYSFYPQHKCKNPIDSLQRVQTALNNIEKQVKLKNNKTFNIFLHNTLEPTVEVDQLINNVRVLKQAIELKYQPQQAVLRMRLMNLIGKKIGYLLEYNALSKMLESLKSMQSDQKLRNKSQKSNQPIKNNNFNSNKNKPDYYTKEK